MTIFACRETILRSPFERPWPIIFVFSIVITKQGFFPQMKRLFLLITKVNAIYSAKLTCVFLLCMACKTAVEYTFTAHTRADISWRMLAKTIEIEQEIFKVGR